MASLFNSKHNKYVSIPDWFKDVQPTVEKPVETKTTYIGSSGNSTAGLSNIAIYNKFVLEDVELDNEALIFENIVLNTIKTEEHEIGDELQATGWSTTDFISVAGNSKMVVNSKIVTNEKQYGIMFYDNTKTIINHIVLKESTEEVNVPENAYYFRISTPSGYADFKIEYKIAIGYTDEQLELSNNAQSDYLVLNEEIPEGFNKTNITPETISLLVQPPLSLTKDINNIIKLSIKDAASDINDMFVWDKKLAAFGYDKELKQAYSYIDGEQQFTTNDKGEEVPVMTDNPEFWMYDPELTNDWIIKTTRQRFSVLDGLMEYDAEKDSFLFHKNIITSGGVVMYADLGDVKVPDLYDGFPLDGVTIKWNYDENGNKINISSVSTGTIKSIDIQGDGGNVFEHAALNEETGILTFYKFNKYTLQDDFDVLKERIDNIKDELLDHFVTVDNTEQYVSGIKHFENGIFIGNRKLYEWKNDVIYLDSNLVVRGGITMYGNDGNVNIPEWYTSLPIASPLYWDTSGDKPVLSINAGSGTIGSIEIVEGGGNAFTSAKLTDGGAKIQFFKSTKFALDSDLQLKWTKDNNKIANWDTAFSWGNHAAAGYALKTYVDDTFVTLKTEQEIEGKKDFTTGGLFVNGNQIVYDKSKRCWKLDGNLLVTGGITMYGDEYQSGGDSGQGLTETQVRSLIESYNFITLNDIRTATATIKGIASFGSADFDISDGHVTLKTHIHIGTPSTYDNNTLYIIA